MSNCLKTFLNSYQLKQHIQTHSKDGLYKCEKCGNFFTDPISLRSHKNHSALCGESDISLKLNNSLDQNPPWRSQSEKESSKLSTHKRPIHSKSDKMNNQVTSCNIFPSLLSFRIFCIFAHKNITTFMNTKNSIRHFEI